nr:TMV resistance protein N-like [Ipomoea batatas]
MFRRICAPIGRLLALDITTVRQTRPNVARVRVEIDLLKPRIDKVWIEITKDKGSWQDIEYEFVPNFCNKCSRLGHKIENCQRRKEDGRMRKRESVVESEVAEGVVVEETLGKGEVAKETLAEGAVAEEATEEGAAVEDTLGKGVVKGGGVGAVVAGDVVAVSHQMRVGLGLENGPDLNLDSWGLGEGNGLGDRIETKGCGPGRGIGLDHSMSCEGITNSFDEL